MIIFFVVGLMIIGTLIGALGASLIKKGSNKLSLSQLLRSSYLWGGLFLYGLSVIFYVLALRQAELSFVYPLVSITYIWTTIFSVKYLEEKMNRWKWIGLIGIILGVMLIGFGV